MSEPGKADVTDVLVGDYTEAQFLRLYRWNLVAGIFHFIQSIIQLILAIVLENFNGFRLPIYSYYWVSQDINGEVVNLIVKQDRLGFSRIAYLIWPFFMLSAIAHFIVISPCAWNIYREQINNGRNYFRWFEYSISSTLMIVIIIMLFGGLDISLIITVGAANATMNLLGLLQEKYNKIRDSKWEVDWWPFNIGCLIGFAPWIVIIIKIIGSQGNSDLPSFVWGVMSGYLVFFNTFPINMFLQYKRVGYWKDYIFGEWCYIILSLASKTLLGWLVFGGLNQPNNY